MKKFTLKFRKYKEGYVDEEGIIMKGYKNPKYYSFDLISEAKDKLSEHTFEGSLDESGMSKSFRDKENMLVIYYVDSEDEENLRV
tara:strand:- start:64 stop:318 length:255 start_codon:yes stop_codon:yes gene_type:complete